MVIEVAKMEIKHVIDASGLDACIQDGLVNADEVVAVIGKTEGNGGVNDFTRILSDRAFRDVLHKHGTRSEAQIKEIPMVWSGGCDGVLTPHATVFASDARSGSPGKSRLVMGTAISDRILPEHIGRPEMVEIVADGVRQAMRDAGITDPADVHYVQTKTPLLTIDTIQDAHDRGHSVFCEVHESMGVSNGTTGLGIAVALGEIGIPEAEDICRNLNLYSSVASCSSGVELDSAQIVLFGNRDGAGGRYRIGHSVMKDALDIDGIYNAIRDAGLDLPERPRASDLDGKVVNCFLKCEADPRAKLRGRRQIMLDDSDVHHHRHSKAAVGAIAALAIGDPAVFVSVDAMHQGPSGGGPAIAIVDLGEPPAKGDRAVGLHLAELVNNPIVERANRIAFDRYLNANPVLVGVGTAGRDLPDMGERTILHAGPPVPWDGMCGPMQGGVIGAILYEGWADTVEDARRLAASGDITFDSCHHHGAVGPMAGLISPSMPIWIVENTEHGNKAYSTLNEGPGKVLRYGAYSLDVIERLKLIENRLAPVLGKALEIGGPVDLKPFLAQALHMGDECHNRNVAGSSLLVKKLVPLALRGDLPAEYVAATVDYVANNDVFFLNVSMAACKAMLDVAHDVPGSSMVTAMARNGVNFGIRVSGTGSSWFETPAPLVEGLYFPGYSIADAGADMGDSAITETAGLGGFAMAASPAIVLFIGGTPAEALSASREMRKITLGVNRAFTLPALDFANTAAGIDIRKVVDSGIQPIVNTGIAHKEAGIGQIGAGITEAPGECFTQAITALHRAVADLDG